MKTKINYGLIGFASLFILLLGIISSSSDGTWTYDYTITTPAGSDSPTIIDDRIREVKAAIQERENVDHYWPLSTSDVCDANVGEHRRVTFFNGGYTDPNLYISPATTLAELYFKDANSHTIQLTYQGYLYGGTLIRMGAIGQILPYTNDGSDTGYTVVGGGGAASLTRGGYVYVFGNEHDTYPGQIRLSPGYSTGTTDAKISATTHIICDVKNPVAEQDAATKNYVDSLGFVPTIGDQMASGTDSVTMPNGFIMKWGQESYSSGSQSYTFPVAFPHACYAILVTTTNSATTYSLNVTARSLTGFTVVSGSSTVDTFAWLAIGY